MAVKMPEESTICKRHHPVVPVLGMPHSGTSMVTALLAQLGVDVAAADVPGDAGAGDAGAGDDQAAGGDRTSRSLYFQRLNEELLKFANCDASGFDAPQKLMAAARVCGRITVEEFRRQEIGEYINRHFSSGPWGWSDSRTILTLDFWLRLLSELGHIELRPVIVVRDPAEVIAMMAGDVMSSGSTQLPFRQIHRMASDLWVAYHRILWQTCCRHRWTVVIFGSFSDPTDAANTAARLARDLGWNDDQAAIALSNFHPHLEELSSRPLTESPAVSDEAVELFEQFKRLAETSRCHLTESAMDRDESRLLRKAESLKKAGRIDAAVELLGKALQIRPQYRGARFMLSYTLMETGHIARSFEHSDWLIESEPDDPVGHAMRAFGLTQQARIQQAITAFRESLRIRPDNIVAWSNLLFSSLYSDSLTPDEITALHVQAGNSIACGMKASQETEFPASTTAEADAMGSVGTAIPVDVTARPLRIGYLSADLKKHPVGYFLRPLLEHHDRRQFQAYCYHTSPAQDELTVALKQTCPHWREAHQMSDLQLAEKIRDDKIDLLIDLSGHSSGNRCGVIVHRAAPVQALYLGYPATSGLPGMDFIIADRHLCPPEANRLYTERVARLDHCFLCFHPHEDAPNVAAAPCESNGFVTFGSFNNLPKISHSTVVLWSELLKRVPDSRLVIKALSLVDSGTRELFYQQFADQGVDRTRIDLLPPTVPLSKFLDEYRRIDIGLDPMPYNGGTTTCEALWMGVPVITLPGQTFWSRMGLSILSTLGQEGWIAKSKEDYMAIAVDLAGQPQLIAEYRRELRDRMRASPLCDGQRFAAGFEECCRWMIESEQSAVDSLPRI